MPRYTAVPFIGPPAHYGNYATNKTGIAIHATANDASATAEASYATRRSDSTSSHFYVDHNSAIQSLDTAFVAWHAGNVEGNERAVSIEITGVNGWSTAQWMTNVDWAKLAKLCAWICTTHRIPARHLSIPDMRAGNAGIYTHDDMRRAWGGTDHTDPGPNFPMAHLVALVQAELGGGDDMPAFQNGMVRTGLGAENATIITCPPAHGALWGAGWLSFACDFEDVTLRVAIHDGKKWTIHTLKVLGQGDRAGGYDLPAGTGKVSVVRLDNPNLPVGWLLEMGAK